MKNLNYDYIIILLLFSILVLIDYTTGVDIQTIVDNSFNFINSYIFFVSLKNLFAITEVYRTRRTQLSLILLYSFTPFAVSYLFEKFPENIKNGSFRYSYNVYVYLAALLQTSIVLILSNRLKDNIRIDNNVRRTVSEAKFPEIDEKDRLGQSTSDNYRHLDVVIKSLLRRANTSLKTTSTSLLIMIVIVFIGGGASIGTVALNELSTKRELEKERIKITQLKDLLSARLAVTNDTVIRRRDSTIISQLNKLFGDENGIIQKVDLKTAGTSDFNWQDIAMRITIAALTLFLVQVFFHIYKYNQKQASQLFTRAETIELFKSADANSGELRTSLLSKMSADPNFDKSPSSPTEQIINVIERATSK